MSGWGERLGERPRGDLVRWVPNVAPACELGVLALLGAGKGPVCVGVMARVDAAMGWRALYRSVGRDALCWSLCTLRAMQEDYYGQCQSAITGAFTGNGNSREVQHSGEQLLRYVQAWCRGSSACGCRTFAAKTSYLLVPQSIS